jgi:peptidoglycan/xylan/chitin deacetylase (PgdA/CDA1 family)
VTAHPDPPDGRPSATRALAAIVAICVAATMAVAGPAGAAGLTGASGASGPSGAEPTVAVSASRDVFSPNGDGRSDVVAAHVRVDADVALTLEVVDAGGAVVRTIVADEAISTGTTDVTWRGLDDERRVVSDGTYAVRATVDDGVSEASAETSVTVDTSPPHLRWRSIAPDPVVSATSDVRFTLSTTATRGSLVVSTFDGRIVHRDEWSDVSGNLERSWNLRDDGLRVWPGRYTATVTAVDVAGNTSIESRSFRDEHPGSTETVRRAEGVGNRVALTFDDCGDDSAWASILSTLDAADVDATFFCPGEQVLASPALARRTVSQGNVVGSHGWDHADLTTLPYDEITRRLQLDERAWWRTARTTAVPFLRPPYGEVDAETLRAAGATGYRWVVLWDDDPADWQRPGATEIAARALSGVRAGSIVVLHVLDQTAAALPSILRGLHARGLRPVTVSELLENARSTTGGSVRPMPV